MPLSSSRCGNHGNRAWLSVESPTGCATLPSRTIRTARPRTSGENLFVVLIIVLHPAQELEPPENPERFMAGKALDCAPASLALSLEAASTCRADAN